MTPHVISDDELDALLVAHDPLRSVALAGGRLDAALTALRDEVRLRGSDVRDRPRPRRRRRRRRLVVVMGGAVVCSTAVVSALSLEGGSGKGIAFPLAVPPAQAAELDRIAHRAAQAQIAGPGPGQWLYERYMTSGGGGANAGMLVVNTHENAVTQQWLGPGNRQRIRTVVESWAFDTPHDRAVYEGDRSGFGSVEGSPGQVFDDAMPAVSGKNPSSPLSMPDTTAGIVSRYHELDGRPGDGLRFGEDLFGEIVRLLTNSTSQTQRAAALSAIKYVHGAQVLGARRDGLGRLGTAIEDRFKSQVTTVMVDEQTGNLLQMTRRFSELSPVTRVDRQPVRYPAKDATTQIVYVARAIVGSMTALPGGGHQPYDGLPVRPYKDPPASAR